MLAHIPAFLLTTLLLAIVPGQGVAMVLRQSILGGKRPALLSVLGSSTGLFIWGSLSSLGLSTIIAKFDIAFFILKWGGVAFLFFLSIQTLLTLKNDFGKFDLEIAGETKAWSAFRLGLLTQLTNVKAAVFALSFIPQFVPSDFSLGLGIFILGSIWPLVSTSWYILLIWTIDRSAVWIQRAKVRRALTGVSALGIAALALGLAFSNN